MTERQKDVSPLGLNQPKKITQRLPERFHNQTPADIQGVELKTQQELDLMKGKAKKICNSRWPKDYFGGIQFNATVSDQEESDTIKIFECASEIRQSQFPDMVLNRIQNGYTDYTKDHFDWANEITQRITEQDLENQKVTQLQLRIIKEPDGLAFWAPQQLELFFENQTKDKCEINGTKDQIKFAAEHYMRELGENSKAELVRKDFFDVDAMKQILNGGQQPGDEFNDDVLDGEDEWLEFDQIRRQAQKDMEFVPHDQSLSFDVGGAKAANNEEKNRLKKIYHLVEHLDENAKNAEELQMTQEQHFDMMRQVTKEKFLAIKEIQTLFKNRINHLIRAKNYEVRCERQIALENGRKIVKQLCGKINNEFQQEVQELRGQHAKTIQLLDYYEASWKKQTRQLAVQEKIISKLSASLFAKQAVKEGERIAIEALTKSEKMAALTFDPNLQLSYLQEPFEFYGGNFKLSVEEKDRFTADTLYRAQELEIEKLKEQIVILKFDIQNQQDVAKAAEQNRQSMQDKYAYKKLQMKQMKEQHTRQKEISEQKESFYLKTIQKADSEFRSYKEMVEEEFELKDAIIKMVRSKLDASEVVLSKCKKILKSKKLSNAFRSQINEIKESKLNDYIEEISDRPTTPILASTRPSMKNTESQQQDNSIVVASTGQHEMEGQDFPDFMNAEIVSNQVASEQNLDSHNPIYKDNFQSQQLMPLQNHAFKLPMTASLSGRNSGPNLQSKQYGFQKHANALQWKRQQLISKGNHTLQEINEMSGIRAVMTAGPSPNASTILRKDESQYYSNEDRDLLQNLQQQNNFLQANISPISNGRIPPPSYLDNQLCSLIKSNRKSPANLRSTTLDLDQKRIPLIAKEIVQIATHRRPFGSKVPLLHLTLNKTHTSGPVFETPFQVSPTYKPFKPAITLNKKKNSEQQLSDTIFGHQSVVTTQEQSRNHTKYSLQITDDALQSFRSQKNSLMSTSPNKFATKYFN